jgi:acyl carrier protein
MGIQDAGHILTFLIRETGIILSGKPQEISGDTPLASMGFDSLSFVELLISIEKKYNVKLIEVGMKPDDM